MKTSAFLLNGPPPMVHRSTGFGQAEDTTEEGKTVQREFVALMVVDRNNAINEMEIIESVHSVNTKNRQHRLQSVVADKNPSREVLPTINVQYLLDVVKDLEPSLLSKSVYKAMGFC